MELRTKIDPIESEIQFSYDSSVFMLGSCFAESIGKQFQDLQFRCMVNPFGIIFNPVSLMRLIRRINNDEHFDSGDLHKNNGLWFSYDHHSKLSSPDKATLLNELNSKLEESKNFISNCDVLVLTLGTSWVFDHLSSGNTVANCHKVNQREFKRRLLDRDEVIKSLNEAIEEIRMLNEHIKFVLTVSPVRHIRNGLVDDRRSKSQLLLAAYEISEKNDFVEYFPSYEIMTDELRDYRFYDRDMIHPSEFAEDYIWEELTKVWMPDSTIVQINKMKKLIAELNHIPIFPESESEKQRREKLPQKITVMEKEIGYPLMELRAMAAKLIKGF